MAGKTTEVRYSERRESSVKTEYGGRACWGVRGLEGVTTDRQGGKQQIMAAMQAWDTHDAPGKDEESVVGGETDKVRTHERRAGLRTTALNDAGDG
jgi:hypothetical protein